MKYAAGYSSQSDERVHGSHTGSSRSLSALCNRAMSSYVYMEHQQPSANRSPGAQVDIVE